MRNSGIDLLRFIAVFLVLGRHLEICPKQTNHFCHEITKAWQRGGWIGVDLFFVLSGFLISSLLFKEAQSYSNIDVKRFLIRRGLKIYPSFWVLLGFTLITRMFSSDSIPIRPLIGELTFTQNYLGGLWNHIWSLSVEEHFYSGIAFLLFLVTPYGLEKNDHFQWISVSFTAGAIMCLSLRLLKSFLLPHSPRWYLYGTHIRIDSLMFGVFLSWLWHYRNLSSKIKNIPSWFFVALGLVFLSPAFYFDLETTWWIPVFGVILFYLGSGGLLMGFLHLHSFAI
jgi:peptidoglycan/LPS O-acetylase OafA/YrhL